MNPPKQMPTRKTAPLADVLFGVSPIEVPNSNSTAHTHTHMQACVCSLFLLSAQNLNSLVELINQLFIEY